MRKLTGIIILALLISTLTISKQAVYAQGSACYQFSDFPTSWTVATGTLIDAFGFSGQALAGVDGTYAGHTSKVASATLNTGGRIIHIWDYHLLYQGVGDEHLASATFILYDSSNNAIDSDTKYIGYQYSFNSGTWSGYSSKDFNVAADHVTVLLRHDEYSDDSGSINMGALAIHLDQYCYDPAQPFIPSPTATYTEFPSPVPTDTPGPTSTPTPSPTPSPSLTPSNTLSPTVTETPGGPSDTPIPATGTPIPATPNGGLAGTYIAPTVGVPGSGGCDDSVTNPCGPLPFGVPGNLPSLNLSSLTPIVAYTLFPTPNPAITATFDPNQATAIALATNVNASSLLAIGTIVINDPAGTPMSLSGAANQIGSNIGNFGGAVRQITGFSLGRAGQVLLFFLLCGLFMAFVRFALIVVRLIKIGIGVVRMISKKIPILSALVD